MISSQWNTDTTITHIEFSSEKACKFGINSITTQYATIDNASIKTLCIPK